MLEKPILAPAARRTIAQRKTEAQAVSNSTTLVDAAGLSFSVGANETWVVTFTIALSFSALGQVRVAVAAPSGATGSVGAELISSGLVPVRGLTTSFGSAISLDSTTGVAGVVIIRATVVNGATPGDIKLQFAQKLSDAGATTILADSSLTAVKV